MSTANLTFGMLLRCDYHRPKKASMLTDATVSSGEAETRNGKQKRHRDADATREQVLQAAMREFAEKGLHGARVEEIASHTSTSKHMIYYYFGSKDGLYAAVLDRVYADFRLVEDSAFTEEGEPLDMLATLVGSAFDSHVENPYRVRILMSENLDRGRHVQTMDHSSQRSLVLSTTEKLIKRGESLGVFRPGLDALQVHMSISALSFYFVSNAYTFSHVFEYDMADPNVRSTRRAEVIETILSRCRA